MAVNCAEHRKFMELVALRARLEKASKNMEEKEKIFKRIIELEKELKVN